MNILFFYESMNLGGQQTQTYYLVRHMAAAGHEMSWAYLFGEGVQSLAAPHAALQRIPIPLEDRDYLFRPWKLWQIARALTALCRERRAQVIVSGSGIGSLICGWAARRLGIPHFRLVGCSLVQVERMLYRFYRVIRIDRLIDGYFGWPAVLDELRQKGVPERKLHLVGDSVDTERFFPLPEAQRAQVRASLGIAPDEIVIGWLGRVAQNMQVGNTLELGARLREQGVPRIRLLFVGGGPWLAELRALAAQRGLASAIFTDWVPFAEVNRYINAMDIVPLLEADPQGGSIMREAMACGRVALSVDGVRATQRRFMLPEATVLVPPEDFIGAAAAACARLAADGAARAALGARAREYAQTRMSFETQARIMTQAFAAAREQVT